MEIEVNGTPVEVLDRIEGFLSLDFPHDGKLRRGDSYVAMKAPHRDDFIGRVDRRLWFVANLGLTIVTLGVWGVLVWLPISLYKRRKHPHVYASVRPAGDGVGEGVEITTGGTYTWQAALDAWLKRTYESNVINLQREAQ